MPVHGIQTQRVREDHPAWPGCGATRRARRPSACMPRMPRPGDRRRLPGRGHRLVVLGDRMDPAFLWRLWTMVGRARRVVSNRLHPVVYAAHLGVDVGVYGDALRIDGEGVADNDRVRERVKLHGATIDPATAKAISDAELGSAYEACPGARGAPGLGPRPVGSAVGYWSTSPARRAHRQPPPTRGSSSPSPSKAAPSSLSFAAWFRAAMSYLPQRLPREIPQAGETREPVPVSGAVL